jgi:hypothetical protein
MAKGITVVTYDADAPTCRDMFINQASTAEIGTSEVDLLAKELHSTGQIGIVSAAATAPNQNAWIGFMKQQMKKYPKMKLVSIVYGNDDPPTATQVTQGLLEKYPNLKGIISPTTVGILAAAQVVDTPKWKGKVIVTGLGTPLEMKKYVGDGVTPGFILWNPANLGFLAAYAAVYLASKKITNAQGQTFTAGKLGSYGRRGPHRSARPAHRVQLVQHQQLQLLMAQGAPGGRLILTRRPQQPLPRQNAVIPASAASAACGPTRGSAGWMRSSTWTERPPRFRCIDLPLHGDDPGCLT